MVSNHIVMLASALRSVRTKHEPGHKWRTGQPPTQSATISNQSALAAPPAALGCLFALRRQLGQRIHQGLLVAGREDESPILCRMRLEVDGGDYLQVAHPLEWVVAVVEWEVIRFASLVLVAREDAALGINLLIPAKEEDGVLIIHMDALDRSLISIEAAQVCGGVRPDGPHLVNGAPATRHRLNVANYEDVPTSKQAWLLQVDLLARDRRRGVRLYLSPSK